MTESRIIHEMFCPGLTIDEIAVHKSLHPSYVRKIIARREAQERRNWEADRQEWFLARRQAWKTCFAGSWKAAVRRLT